ncbi:peptidase M16 domain protein [Synechocystis sp. LKSZ1]
MVQLQEHSPQASFPARIFTLDHGLTLIHQYLPTIPVAVVDVWVRAGAIVEPNVWPGMAHFLEHMIFKGTKRIPPGVFDQVIECNGGMTNAATSHDYAHFFLTTASAYLPQTLPYLAEILLQAEIPEEEFYCERDVVLEEIRGSEDDPDWLVFQSLCQSLYPNHPYGRSVLGTAAQLQGYTPNQMRCFHRTHYQPDNMTVVMVGDVPESQALQLIQNTFEQFFVPSECPPTHFEASPPLVEIRRQEHVWPNLGAAQLMMGWTGPGINRLEDNIGLDLLSAVLTGGRCARLVRQLREERQWVADIHGSFSLQKEASLFSLTAWLGPEYLERVEAWIRDSIRHLQQAPISAEELARAQRLLCHDYIFSTETPGQLAGLYGYYHTLASAESALAYPQIIQNLTAPTLQKLAQQYLSPDYYAVTILRSED